MITTSLIHIAIWTQFAAFHAASVAFDWHVVTPAPVQPQGEVVLDTMRLKFEGGFVSQPLASFQVKIAMLDHSFIEQCAVRSDIRCPLPKEIVTFHWDIETLTFKNVVLASEYHRIPIYWGLLTVEFDKQISNILSVPGLKTKPVSQLLRESQGTDFDGLGTWQVDVEMVHNGTSPTASHRTEDSHFNGPAKNSASRLSQVWHGEKAPAAPCGKPDPTWDSIFDSFDCFDPATNCFDPKRYFWCREEGWSYRSTYLDPAFISDMGRCNDVLVDSDVSIQRKRQTWDDVIGNSVTHNR